jgi:hypothetical protein
MSSTLKIEPANRKKQSLSYELKSCLQKKYGGLITDQIMNISDLPYLKGLLDAGVEDAKIVLDMIEKYDEVILDEEF